MLIIHRGICSDLIERVVREEGQSSAFTRSPRLIGCVSFVFAWILLLHPCFESSLSSNLWTWRTKYRALCSGLLAWLLASLRLSSLEVCLHQNHRSDTKILYSSYRTARMTGILSTDFYKTGGANEKFWKFFQHSNVSFHTTINIYVITYYFLHSLLHSLFT